MRPAIALCALTAALVTVAGYKAVDLGRWLACADLRIDWSAQPALLAWWEQIDGADA
jgi:hypothetical protein